MLGSASRGGRPRALLARLALVALAGCGGSSAAAGAGATAATTPDETAAEPGAPLVAGAFSPSEVVTLLTPSCDEGSADDDCDGFDDDCDGHIDDGCGLASGDLQITVAWSTGADLDLYVVEPLGDTLSFQRARSSSGGRVDRVGRGQCAEAAEGAERIENLVWDGARVLRGTYRVVLHYWGECQSAAGPTEVVVSMAVGGELLGTVGYVLSPNELTEVASFDVE